MNLKNIYFSWLIYWGKMKGLLNGIAEAIILLASLASFFVLIYQFGFVQTPDSVHILERSRPFILLAFFTGITLRYVVRFQEIIQEKMLYLDISIYFLLFAVLSSKIFFKDAIAHSLPYLSFLTKPLFVYVLLLLLSTIHLSRQTFTLMQTRIKPSLLFLLSFVFVILVGAGLLSLPNATTHRIPFIGMRNRTNHRRRSHLFHAYRTYYHPDFDTDRRYRGHDIYLFLRPLLYGEILFYEQDDAERYAERGSDGRIVPGHLKYSFRDLVYRGDRCLFYLYGRARKPAGRYAMFHAVSAFCNAGISTLSGNMYDPLVADKYNLHFWIAMLIIFGGLGFPIVFNYLKLLHHLLMNGIKILIGKQKHYIHTPRIINVHTYIVVISTLILLITGTAFYLFFEYDNTLGDLPLRGKLANAFLGAVTPRTAGFNVADMATLAPPTLMLTLILMVIGAAPMSTGGGLKVTTVFVALVTTLNAAREKDKVEVRKREIAPFAIRRAFAIIMMYFMWVAIATWVLSYTEKGAPLFSLLFEVVSALSTVGLSIDYTPHLTPIGKIIIISTMLVGRIGVLAFLVSFCKEYTKKDYTYPQENILM